MSLADPFIEALLGKQVSHVWRGAGSALFLEFGKLVPTKLRNGKAGEPDSEVTLMIEWSWRIENPRSIIGGTWSDGRRWPGMFKKIKGARVTSVEFIGYLPEICVSLDNGCRVASFSTVEGQPEWAVIERKDGLGSLCVKKGRLNVEAFRS